MSNNIAEGFERGTTAELLAFIYIARGSAGEVRSVLRFLDRWPEMEHARVQIAEMQTFAESCSRQLRGWADSLQNSEIKGQRHLSDQGRSTFQSRKRADEFLTSLEATQTQRVSKWAEEMSKRQAEESCQPEREPSRHGKLDEGELGR